MRADANLKSIPVIILTSANTEAERFREYAQVANGYIRNLTGLGDFTRILRSTLDFVARLDAARPARLNKCVLAMSLSRTEHP